MTIVQKCIILVLMDNALRQKLSYHQTGIVNVLILVLMDNALRRGYLVVIG